jgi:hypothetical protein
MRRTFVADPAPGRGLGWPTPRLTPGVRPNFGEPPASAGGWRARLRIGRCLAAAAVLFTLTGCGDRLYPVRGTVTLDDGTPVTKGMIICERYEGGPPVSAQGAIQPDGTYRLGTAKPGDGLPPGKYRVLINAMDLSDLPDDKKDIPFDSRYLNFQTSGLELEVRNGEVDYPIRLAKSPRRR